MHVHWSYDFFFSWKCLLTNMVLWWGFSSSFLWLFSLLLKGVCLSYILLFRSREFHQVYDICAGMINFVKKFYVLFESVDSWKLMLLWLGCSTEFFYFQNTGSISLISKCFFYFLYNVVFDFVTVNELRLVTGFVLKNIFQEFINW